MIKVLEEGKKIPTYKVECSHCGSVLSYTKDDMQFSIGEYMGACTSTDYIHCPVCNRKVIVGSDYWSYR